MSEARESIHCATNAVCDVLCYLGDVCYAILPADLAHDLGDLKKSFWRNVRSAIDKELEWIDERVAGGDRLREEWKRAAEAGKKGQASEPAN